IHLYTDVDDLGPPLGQCRRICFYCDNQAVIAILSAKSSKIPCVMNLVWLITFQTLSFNFTFTAEHVPGVNNVIAEYLVSKYMSPMQYVSHSFRIRAATTAETVGLPDCLIKVLRQWKSNVYHTYIKTPTRKDTILSI
ncbi:unnamed protein product, partial [Porites evermanni]